MDNQFSSQARTAISLAKKIAGDGNHSYIGTEHLLAGMIREGRGTAGMLLAQEGVTLEKLMNLIDRLIAPPRGNAVTFEPQFTPRAKKVLELAVDLARDHRETQAGTEHILMAILQESGCVASRLLFTMDVSIQKLYQEILKVMGETEEEQKRELAEFREPGSEGGDTPTLDQYSRDLTAQARRGELDPVVGREEEITRVVQILSRRKKNNPCLIGEPGVGKTAIVEGLAQRIADGTVPDNVRGKRLMILDLSGMVAGSKYRGEFEERIKRVIAEVMDHRNVLLFIDEIHTIIGAGGAEGALDASNILKPSLARGEIQLIGATTIEEYRKRIEKDAALERRFQPVNVEEPSDAQTLEILRGLRPYYEKHHQVTIGDDALEAAVRLSGRYINDRFQPDKAIDLIDEAASRAQLGDFAALTARQEKINAAEKALKNLLDQKEAAIENGDFALASDLQKEQEKKERELEQQRTKGGKNQKARIVGERDIERTVAIWTRIPVERIAESESKRLAKLETILHKRVVGQDEAVTAVAKAVRRGRVGLKDPGRPIGSFLFLGPTGVGKTELSKALAEAVFGTEDAMIRIDMSEYMEKHSVSKLIGSPPGYVGYEEGGQLSEKVRRNPYSVLLFDEIEKAHPDVFNILLQVLDDGHITDAQGRRVSFKETIIIMTSNAGANRILQPKKLGFLSDDDEKQNYERMKGQVMEEVRKVFRPEFLNRIDEIQVFHALNRENMKSIVGIILADLKKRCKEQMQIRLEVSAQARAWLIDKSFDSKYGARPLKRAVQTNVEDPLAEKLLSGEVQRNSTVRVGCTKDGLSFRCVPDKEPKID